MSTATSETGPNAVQPSWRRLAIAGGVVAILGALAILLPVGTGIAISYAVGAALLVGGIVHAGHVVATGGRMGSLWQAVLAGVSILAGLLVLANPIVGLLSLTLVAIAYLLADGLAELWTSLRMEGGAGRGWVAASGVLSLVLAGFLWAGFPVDALWLVGVVVGVSLLATGLSMVAIAYGVRGTDEQLSAPSGTSRGA